MPHSLDKGPIPLLEQTLEDAKQSEDWFKAVVLSAIQLERFGYRFVKEYLENLKVEQNLIEKLLYRPAPRKIAEYLSALNSITKEECETIIRLSKWRNKFVHRTEGYKYLIGSKASKEYEPLIIESIRILREKLNAVRIHVTP